MLLSATHSPHTILSPMNSPDYNTLPTYTVCVYPRLLSFLKHFIRKALQSVTVHIEWWLKSSRPTCVCNICTKAAVDHNNCYVAHAIDITLSFPLLDASAVSTHFKVTDSVIIRQYVPHHRYSFMNIYKSCRVLHGTTCNYKNNVGLYLPRR